MSFLFHKKFLSPYTTLGTSDRSSIETCFRLFFPFVRAREKISREMLGALKHQQHCSIIKHNKKINYHNKTTWRWVSLFCLSFSTTLGARRRNRLTLVPRFFRFNFSSWSSFPLNSTYGYQDDGVRREEELILWPWILIFIFHFCLFRFVHWLRALSTSLSWSERKKEREEKAVRHNVCSMLWFFFFDKSNSDDVIELCHENFMLQSHVVNFTSSSLFHLLCRVWWGSFICRKANPTNVIVRVVFIFVFRLHISSLRPTCDRSHEHTRTARSRKYPLSLIC